MEIRYSVKRLSTAHYIRNYLDLDLTGDACRSCPQYAKSWNCPPFDLDYLKEIGNTSHAIIVALNLESDKSDGISSINELNEKSIPFRLKLEKRIRAWETEYGGIAFTTIGKCCYCGELPCARITGYPCRHPELVRPSLEAIGFNLIKTSEELFGISMEWNVPKNRHSFRLSFIFGYFR